MTAAVAGAVAAGGCCAAPTRWRARVLAIVMALACVPMLPDLIRMAGAIGLIAAAVALAVGARRLSAPERTADLHRALGGTLMAGMLLAGGHSPGVLAGGHDHGWSPHVLFALASVGYLGWTIVGLVRPAQEAMHGRAARIELSAMGVMFALVLVAMVVG